LRIERGGGEREREMKIWEDERRSCRGREKKTNVPVYSDFRDSNISIKGFFINGFIDDILNIYIFNFFIGVSVCKV